MNHVNIVLCVWLLYFFLWCVFSLFCFSQVWEFRVNSLHISHKAKDACYMVRKRLAKVGVFYLSLISFFQLFVDMFTFCFWLFCFLVVLIIKKKKKKSKNIENFQKVKNILFCVLFCFCFFFFSLRIILIMISLSWLRTYLILWRNIESMCCIIKCISYF